LYHRYTIQLQHHIVTIIARKDYLKRTNTRDSSISRKRGGKRRWLAITSYSRWLSPSSPLSSSSDPSSS